MELDFREFCEGWKGGALGAGLGFTAGSMLGMPTIGAALGGWAGHKIQQKLYGDPHNPYNPPKVDPKYFVYYKDIDGRVNKELLPNEYQSPGEEAERANADQNYPYYYYFDERRNKVVKKTKAGYQAYQRRARYGQQYGGQRGQQRGQRRV